MSEPTLDPQRAEMARILGVDEPVSADVLQAALADASYAHNLLVARRDRRFLDRLLARPPKQAGIPSLSELAVNAASSLARWAATGFSTVDDAKYAIRITACAGCPHLAAPPETRALLYKLAGAPSGTKSACGKCGCVVTTKARRPNDTCPDPDPANPGFNRWGEPLP